MTVRTTQPSVVLCASFPTGERGEAVRPYYQSEIALAVGTVAEAVLRTGARFIFGGHPTISPLVLHVARLLDAGSQVTIFQSEHYITATTDAVRTLVGELGAELRMTRATGGPDASLTAMRSEMFTSQPAAVFFCGGMDGLDEELALARSASPNRFLLVEPGGRAAQLARHSNPIAGDQPLLGRAYASLALRSLRVAGLGEQRATGPYEDEMYRPDDRSTE